MIVALMIVGEGEANRYLHPVLDRVARWADVIHVALEPEAGGRERRIASDYASTSFLKCSTDENEGMAKNQAWVDMAQHSQPSPGDLVSFVKPTEVVLSPEAVRGAAKVYTGLALNATINHMWDVQHIRVDGSWAPADEMYFLPFRRGARYPDYRLHVGRLPTYNFGHPEHASPVTEVLDYDMLSLKDKVAKAEWFERVGAEEFYSIDHMQSISRTPMLQPWTKGGILSVERDPVG